MEIVMIVILTKRRWEVSDVITGRITKCGDSDDSDIDSEEVGGTRYHYWEDNTVWK